MCISQALWSSNYHDCSFIEYSWVSLGSNSPDESIGLTHRLGDRVIDSENIHHRCQVECFPMKGILLPNQWIFVNHPLSIDFVIAGAVDFIMCSAYISARFRWTLQIITFIVLFQLWQTRFLRNYAVMKNELWRMISLTKHWGFDVP